jgi:hypothetical protein
MSTPNRPSLNFQAIQREVPASRPLSRKHDRSGTWGWIIYRTVYTPESHEHWEEFKKHLDDLILSDFEGFHCDADPGSLNVGRENYCNYILEDEQRFKNASPEDLEVHFQQFTAETPDIDRDSRYSATWKAFLIVDEKAFNCVLSAPVQKKAMFRQTGARMQDYIITAVARQPDPDNVYYDEDTGEERILDEDEPDYEHINSPPSWPGQIQVSAVVLYTFWEELTGEEAILEE